ncbi:MAG TPA: YetF domain-containing protein [Flavisolibacter sp.]|nr:YetF domain-containing protein [Flavisolibacter sp.]
MKFMNEWWGINENISPLEIAARSAIMFVVALLLMRMAGMRPFGKGEPFDNIITFLIGGILSRGVVGATPFFSTVFSMAVIIIIHKIFAKLSIYSKWFGAKVKGEKILLFRDGVFEKKNMNRVNITEHDILEDLRLHVQSNSLNAIKEVYMERSGRISFVKKDA